MKLYHYFVLFITRLQCFGIIAMYSIILHNSVLQFIYPAEVHRLFITMYHHTAHRAFFSLFIGVPQCIFSSEVQCTVDPSVNKATSVSLKFDDNSLHSPCHPQSHRYFYRISSMQSSGARLQDCILTKGDKTVKTIYWF